MSETSDLSPAIEPAPFLTMDEDGHLFYDWVPETGFPEVAPECGIYYQEAPPTNSWYNIYSIQEGQENCQDFWMTASRLKVARDSPCIPRPYEVEDEELRVLYITGLPNGMKRQEVLDLFAPYANIEKVVVLYSFYHDTFRWLVFRTDDEADAFKKKFNGATYKDTQLQVIRQSLVEERRTTSIIFKGESMEDWNFNGGLQELQDQLDAVWLQEIMEGGMEMQRPVAGLDGPLSEQQTVHGHPEPSTPVRANEDSTLADDESGTAGVPKIEVSATETAVSTPASAATAVHTPLNNFVTQATSWANIVNASNLANRSIDTNPTNRERRPSRLNSVGRIPTVAAIRAANAESEKELMRVVFLIDIPNNITLQMVSDAIHEGPLRSINFGIDGQTNKRYVGVVFQHAEDAERFHRVLAQEKEDSAPGRFRFVVDTGRDTFHSDEVIKAMGAPTWATRRLTLVKGGFFFKCNDHHLTKFVEKLVSPEKIQRIHLYNGGNATIIFSDVASAILVKKHLDELAEPSSQLSGRPSFWEGLQTTFSKDPCVQPMDMKTAMHD
jgi:hypothetical protein